MPMFKTHSYQPIARAHALQTDR